MCIGFCVMMVSIAFSGHINVMVFAGAARGVVSIQTCSAIWVGKFVSDAFHNCNEHFEVISDVLFAYRAAIQDGGFAKGWKGVVMLQNELFASQQTQNWVVESSTAIVAYLVMSKYLMSIS